MEKITIPKHLKAATRRWYKQVASEYELESHHYRLLTLACEAWDRATGAREVLQREGLTIVDRFGQVKAHPLIRVKEQAEIAFARLVRELNLDIEQARAPGRPPRLY